MIGETTRAELDAVLDRVVAETLAAHEILAPPVNTLQLAVRLGFRIAWNEGQAGRARLVRSPNDDADSPGTILLTPEPRIERRQWAVAHEIGESLAWRVFEGVDQDPRDAQPNLREQIANRLAGRLLVPEIWFRPAGEEWDWDLLRLKKRFSSASHELLARRMLDMDVPAVITIFDQGSIVFRNGNLACRPPRWSAQEETARRRASDEKRPIDDTGPPRVRAWALHEPNWLREIIRTEDWVENEDADWD